ncbi:MULTISPECIES: hypothetical protein [Bacillaceae]|uniref:DUF4340 domain-containing protein n=1 Tax=Evansella alkalicola TaxID=745819 RepID=A0ABS6K2K6_9BACI|nr:MULTISPECIES: hypothetical protein [Bacillaceae]MBU9724347.1 hypothetical protein [Bacillus alkalicola]
MGTFQGSKEKEHGHKQNNRTGKSRSGFGSGRKFGFTLAILIALSIGFLLSYQWFWGSSSDPASVSPEEEEQDETSGDKEDQFSLDGESERIFIREGVVHEFSLNKDVEEYDDYTRTLTQESREVLMNNINDRNQLSDAKVSEVSTGQSTVDVKIEMQSGEVYDLQLITIDDNTYLNIVGEEEMYRYANHFVWDLRANIYKSTSYPLEEAIDYFTGELNLPMDESFIRVSAIIEVQDAVELFLRVMYREEERDEEDNYVFSAVFNYEGTVLEDAYSFDYLELHEIDGIDYYVLEKGSVNYIRWLENGTLYNVEFDTAEVDEMFAELFPDKFHQDKEESLSFKEALEEYAVFTDFELVNEDGSHHGAESVSFLYSDSYDYILGFGHQAHAVYKYELFEVDEEERAVTVIRRANEDIDDHFRKVREEQGTESMADDLIQYLLDFSDPISDLFFHHSPNEEEVAININGQSVQAYLVYQGDKGLNHYFKKGEGLIMKEFYSDATLELFGEPLKAVKVD